jgi:hypothetical protein
MPPLPIYRIISILTYIGETFCQNFSPPSGFRRFSNKSTLRVKNRHCSPHIYWLAIYQLQLLLHLYSVAEIP